MKLDKGTNFIPAQDVLNEVRNELRSYFERGVVDDSLLYPVIRSCLSKMGLRVHPSSNIVIPINNYKGCLPDDFHKLSLAIGCFQYNICSQNTENPQLYETYEGIHAVLKPSEICVDQCGDDWNIIQKYDTFSVNFQEYYPLKVSSSSMPFCTNSCFNKSTLSQNEIDICGKDIHTNFESGYVYMEYIQNLETLDDLLIPDFAPIRDWIKTACIHKCLYSIYYNGDDTIRNKYMDHKADLLPLELNAKSFVSRAGYKEMYDLRRFMSGRYSKFSQQVYGYR